MPLTFQQNTAPSFLQAAGNGSQFTWNGGVTPAVISDVIGSNGNNNPVPVTGGNLTPVITTTPVTTTTTSTTPVTGTNNTSTGAGGAVTTVTTPTVTTDAKGNVVPAKMWYEKWQTWAIAGVVLMAGYFLYTKIKK